MARQDRPLRSTRRVDELQRWRHARQRARLVRVQLADGSDGPAAARNTGLIEAGILKLWVQEYARSVSRYDTI